MPADDMKDYKPVTGQQMSASQRGKAQQEFDTRQSTDAVLEAAGFTEEIIRWLNKEWNEREFTPEQRIFSIALATINFRQHFPDAKGGVAKFDEVSSAAKQYYIKNAG
jgi:hypothetical protein